MKPYKRKRFKDSGKSQGPEKLTKDYSHIKGKREKWICPPNWEIPETINDR